MTLQRRVEALEQQARPPVTVVGFRNDWMDPPHKSEAEARAECGPDDLLIVVEYTNDWRCADGQP